MSHRSWHRFLRGTLVKLAAGAVVVALITLITPAQPASAEIAQNPSQDPSSFGWSHPPNAVSLNVQGHEVYGGVASGTEGIFTGLINDLLPQIPGGINSIGGYEDRANVNNPSKLSFHAYGLAIDINADQNPNGADPDSLSGQGVIPPVAARAAAAKWGMEWGGDFNGTPDPMHFEVHLTPADAVAVAQAQGTGSAIGGGAIPDNNSGSAAVVASTPCGSGTNDVPPDSMKYSNAAALSAFIGGFAIAALCWTLQHIDIGTAPQVTDSQSNGWFLDIYAMFKSIGLWILVPLLLIATIASVARGSYKEIVRIWLVYLPVSAVGAVVAVGIVQLLLNMTDDFSQSFTNSIEADVARFFAGIADGFGVKGLSMALPIFVTFFAGMMLGIACIAVYIILALREASVYIATAFLPLSFAFFVWPATAHFFRKLAEFLFAMIFSKLIMVAGIALAIAALASVTGLDGNDGGLAVNGGDVATSDNGAQGNQSWIVWFGQTMSVTVMFAIVALAPNMTTKLISNVSLGGTGRDVDAHSSRPKVMNKVVAADRWVAAGGFARSAVRYNSQIRKEEELAGATSAQEQALAASGVNRGRGGNFVLTEDDFDSVGTPSSLRHQIAVMSASNNVRDIDAAHTAYALGDRITRIDRAHASHGSVGGATLFFTKPNPDGSPGEVIVLADLATARGDLINWTDPGLIRRTAEDLVRAGHQDVRVMVPLDSIVADSASATAQYGNPGQHQNAKLIERQLQELNERYGSNAHVVLNAPADIGDAVNAQTWRTGAGATSA